MQMVLEGKKGGIYVTRIDNGKISGKMERSIRVKRF